MATDIQKAASAQLALQNKAYANALVSTLTTSEESEKFVRSLTIEKIVETSQPISQLEKYVPRKDIKLLLDVHLLKFIKSLNLKWTISDDQVMPIVEDLLYKYPNESIEDFLLVFRKARMGEFKDENGNSTIYRLDGAVIFGWMDQYLEQKYEVLERNLYKEKDQVHNAFKKAEKDYLKLWKDSIDLLAEKDRKAGKVADTPKTAAIRMKLNQLTREQILEEGQADPKRKVEAFTPEEYKKMHDMKVEYGRECTDIYSGNVKPGMPSFEDWLKDKL